MAHVNREEEDRQQRPRNPHNGTIQSSATGSCSDDRQ